MASQTMPVQIITVWWQNLGNRDRYEDLKDELLFLRWPTKMFFKWQWLRLRGCGTKVQVRKRTKLPLDGFPHDKVESICRCILFNNFITSKKVLLKWSINNRSSVCWKIVYICAFNIHRRCCCKWLHINVDNWKMCNQCFLKIVHVLHTMKKYIITFLNVTVYPSLL